MTARQYTVRELMRTPIPPFLNTDSSSSISTKLWTQNYDPFSTREVSIWSPTYADVDAFLGPGPNTLGADSIGLHVPVHRLNTFSKELIKSEGDVTRDFHQCIHPVALAFSGSSQNSPKLWSQSLSGSSRSSKTVDFQMAMHHQIPGLDRPAMIVEMKRPGVIDEDDWLGETPSATAITLQKEMIAYSDEYECPLIALYDGIYLVIVQFRASKAEDIGRNCPIDICFVPRAWSAMNSDQCTVQYALYRMASRGWMRLCASLGYTRDESRYLRARTSLELDGYKRYYSYYSGEPVWYHGRQKFEVHPNGYKREFSYNHQGKACFIWRTADGNIADTPSCFISQYDRI